MKLANKLQTMPGKLASCVLLFGAVFMWQPDALADEQWYNDNVPEGSWVVVSNNTPSAVDPCPESNCPYSGPTGSAAMVYSWSGAMFADNYGSLGGYIIGPSGGHRSYDGDNIHIFDLETRLWSNPYEPTWNPAPYDSANGETTGGRPVAAHSYGLQGYHPTYGGPSGAIFAFNSASSPSAGGVNLRGHAYPLDRNDGTWDRIDYLDGISTGGTATFDPNRNRFLVQTGFAPYAVRSLEPTKPSGQQIGIFNNTSQNTDHVTAIDPGRDIMVVLDFRYQRGVYVTDLETGVRTQVNTSGAPSGLESTSQMGFEYCPPLDGFIAYRGRGESQTYLLRPPSGNPATGTWTWTTLNATGGVTPQTMRSGREGRIYTRWQWVERLNLFLLLQRYNGPVYAYRPPGVQPPDGSLPRPLVNLSAAPSSISAGQNSTLSWTVSNATSCTAGGGWSGAKSVGGGSQVISNIESTTNFTLTCAGEGGTGSASTTVNVATANAPTVNLTVSSPTVPEGGSVALTWTSTDADSCQASGAWGGARATSGTASVGPLSVNSVFTLTCTNSSGSGSDQAAVVVVDSPIDSYEILQSSTSAHLDSFVLDGETVSGLLYAFVVPDSNVDEVQFYLDNVSATGTPYNIEFLEPFDFAGAGGFDTTLVSNGAHTITARIILTGGATEMVTVGFNVDNAGSAAPPVINFSASDVSVDFGGFTTLTWTTTDATSCEASGAWVGSHPVNGSAAVGPLTENSNFILVCSGPGGSDTEQVAILVGSAPAPTVTLNTSPSSVGYQGSSVLTWSSTNTDSCVASGAWSGGRSLSGSESVGPLVTNVTYTLTCTGPGGQASDTASVSVAAPPAPVVTLTASPETVDYNGASTLTWSALNANNCVGIGAWSGTRPVTGTLTVGPLTATSSYGLNCTGDGGTGNASVTVNVNPVPAPQLTLTATPASVPFQGSSVIAWSATNATSCSASGAWSGARGTAGSEATGPLSANVTYSMSCSGPGGDITDSVTVTVDAAPPPAISFAAIPDNVDFNGASSLTWSVSDADSCTASGGWSGSRATAGNSTVGPLQSDTTFTLTCSGSGGNNSATVTVTVNDPPPSITLLATPDAIAFNGTSNLIWSAQNATSCNASGAWAGTRAVTGTQIVGPLSTASTFTLECFGNGGSDTATVTIDVADPGVASLSLQSSLDAVASGASTILTWSSSDVDTCTASGSWSGSRATSGSETVGPLTSASTFVMTCTGSGGSVTRSASVTILDSPPTVTLTATPQDVAFGGDSVLNWSSTDADSCVAFGGWSGTKATSGSEQVNALQADTSFVLLCTGPGGQTSATANVTVAASPPPVVSLQANPAQVDVNGVSTLTWSATNATSCSAAGGWSGSRAAAGTEQVGPLSAATSFSLVCNGPGGQALASTQVQINTTLPTLTISASPQSVGYNGSSQISWSSTGATACAAFGAWSGSRSTSGSETVANLTADSDYILVCSGPGGSVTQTASVSVGTAAAPEVTIFADPESVGFEGTSTISWSTQDASSCTAFGSWSGARDTDGVEVVGPLTADSNFILLCSGPGGNTARSAQVSVTSAPLPAIILTATPEVAFGGTANISWSVENANVCTASGGWTGNVAMQGSQAVGPLFATSSFTLVCSGAGGTNSRSVAVMVANAADLPLENFEQMGVGTSLSGWYQSDENFSLAFRPFNFVVEELNANNVLSVSSSGQNFHNHYLTNSANSWGNYRFTGRTMVSASGQASGMTVLSSYPTRDAYYALAFAGSGAFELTARGTTCSGDLNTGVVPQANAWYRFSIEAETTDSATSLRAKVWADGDSEPDNWQAQCQDTSAGRLQSGTVGIRGSNNGNGAGSRWDDLLVVPLDSQVVAPPIMSLSASPTLISPQGFSTLTWSATNAVSCTASGDWSGARIASGSELVGPLDTNSSFTLVCDGPGGSIARSVAVAIADSTQPPVVTISAAPDMVATGGSTILTWSASNASICAASGAWAGIRQPSGSQAISGITVDSTYNLTCIGPGGTTTTDVEVLLSDIPRDPQLSLVIDFSALSLDGIVTLRWESRFTDTCTASGDWSGDFPRIGQQVIGPITVAAQYTLTCTGSNGPVSDSVFVSYVDDDADGMADVWEMQFFGSLENNGLGDSDGDGLIDQREYASSTNPFSADTDGDGDNDFDEIQFGSDPRDAGSTFSGSRPATPVLTDESNLPLWGFTADVAGGSEALPGSALLSSEWQFSLDSRFRSVVFSRTIPEGTACTVPGGVMDPGVRYYVRTRHINPIGLESLWSDTATMTASTNYPNDADGNGVDDSYQPPASADANGNGTPDLDEGLCNLYDAQGGSLIGIQTNIGVVRCYRSVPNSDLPSAATADGDMPFGTFSFRVEGLLADSHTPARAFVTLWLPEELPADTGWVIYDPSTQELIDFSDNVTINGNRAIVTYTDGALGDKDGIVNGIIVDPSGPLVPVQATPPAPPAPPVTPTPPDSGGSGGGGGGGGGAPAPWSLMLLGALLAARRRATGGWISR